MRTFETIFLNRLKRATLTWFGRLWRHLMMRCGQLMRLILLPVVLCKYTRWWWHWYSTGWLTIFWLELWQRLELLIKVHLLKNTIDFRMDKCPSQSEDAVYVSVGCTTSYVFATYLLETSPLFFLIGCRLMISDGDCWLLHCASSMAAEFGVGNADGTEVGVAMICWMPMHGLESLLIVCDWPVDWILIAWVPEDRDLWKNVPHTIRIAAHETAQTSL